MTLPRPFYDADGVTLYHGDCREIGPILGVSGHVITDPPYLTAIADASRFSCSGLGVRGQIKYAPADRELLRSIASAAQVICRGWLIVFNDFDGVAYLRGCLDGSDTPPTKAVGVWAKGKRLVLPTGKNTTAAADCDHFLIAKHVDYRQPRDRRSFFSTPSASPNSLAVVGGKPLNLMIGIVETYSEIGDTVIDLYAGGGTTLLACKETRRRAIGIESNRHHCDIIVRRLSQRTMDFNIARDES